MFSQKTLNKSFCIEGNTLWTGTSTKVKIHPAEKNTGIILRYVKNGRKTVLPLEPNNATVSLHRVVISANGYELKFVEHLLSALWGMGVDNAIVDVYGNELPFFDGSALPYVTQIQRVGLLNQNAERRHLKPKDSLLIMNNGKWMHISPAQQLTIFFAFKHKGLKLLKFSNLEDIFAEEIAPARTFASGSFPHFRYPFEIKKSGELNLPYPFRFRNEMLRHKVLDLIGDLAVLGIRPLVRIIAFGTGHSETHKAIKLISKESEYELRHRLDSLQDSSSLSLLDDRQGYQA